MVAIQQPSFFIREQNRERRVADISVQHLALEESIQITRLKLPHRRNHAVAVNDHFFGYFPCFLRLHSAIFEIASKLSIRYPVLITF